VPRLQPIGVIRSEFRDLDDTPVQAALAPEAHGVVELDPSLADALDGLEGFDYAWLLTWLGPTGGRSRSKVNLRPVPFLLSATPREVGYFATRTPRRVNPIGLSLVRILAVEPPKVRFAGVDMVDGTLLLDIKPYVARLDQVKGTVRSGWFDTVSMEAGATPNSLKGQAGKASSDRAAR
jgi:tRNA-Thr(GGU) m(6)t(6)A37 methyltransferase TsaA